MSIQAFFKDNAIQVNETEDFIVSARFKDEEGNPIPWKLKAMSPKRFTSFSSRTTTVNIDGNVHVDDASNTTFDGIAECVVFPNLRDTDLQNSYGVVGVADLLDKMLTTSEFTRLNKKINAMHRGDIPLEKMADEVKND